MRGGLKGRGVSSVFLVMAGLLVLPAAASATTRYAAPGGTADDTVCVDPGAAKCSIGAAAGGPDVVGADEVVILPGSYSDVAGDLEGDDNLVPDNVQITAGDVHGSSVAQRPVITLTGLNPTAGAFTIFAGALSDVEIDTSANRTNLQVFGGTVDRVIARSSSTVFGTIVCTHTGGTVRDSACLADGGGATAIGTSCSCGATGTVNLTVRNVTASATGANSFGASYAFGGSAASWQIGAENMIASGTSADVRVSAQDFNATCPTALTITIDHSNFATTSTTNAAACGSAGSIVAGAGNQTGTPLIASDGYHELTGSPTTNAGTTDASNGNADIDGQNRTIDSIPDIGADELGRPTTTQLICNPNPILVEASTTCSATVLGPPGTGVPQGTVEFSSDTAGGAFTPDPSCTLQMAGENGSDCQVTYTPGTVGTGTHQVTATFGGSTTRDPSSGSTGVGVTAPITQTQPPPAAPGRSTTPGKKKCKKKKKHRSAAAAKKKCKKKKR